MKTTAEFFRALREAGTQRDWLDRMQARTELYSTLEYDPAEESWPGYSSSRV
jgi:2-methylisocitrate lyase-like PEP mutase family enzyme